MEEFNEIFNLTDRQPAPTGGSVLVAKPTVDDGLFNRSVVLLISHSDSRGSMGLIMNKITHTTLDEVVPGLICDEEIPLFYGGPVGGENLFYIHTLGPEVIPDAVEVSEGIYVGGSYDAVKQYINGGKPVAGHIKFIVGYSGWTAGQLSGEIESADWAVDLHPDLNLIMRGRGSKLWQTQVERLGSKYHMWLNWPRIIGLN